MAAVRSDEPAGFGRNAHQPHHRKKRRRSRSSSNSPIRFHLGFFIALGVAWLVYWLLFKTTWGFNLRTVGSQSERRAICRYEFQANTMIWRCRFLARWPVWQGPTRSWRSTAVHGDGSFLWLWVRQHRPGFDGKQPSRRRGPGLAAVRHSAQRRHQHDGLSSTFRLISSRSCRRLS